MERILMTDIISQYQHWKEQGEELRVKAKQAMESRFHELLAEAVRIAQEYRMDFGSQLKTQSPVTAFRYKVPAKVKGRKAAKPIQKPSRGQAPAEPAPANPNPKVVRLQSRLATARKKVEDAKLAGKPTKALDDRVYEIEDEIRLSTQP
jgi:hypothetical protein